MERRKFLVAGAVAPAALSAPAVARAQSRVQWRMPTSFPTGLSTIHGSAQYLAERVSQLTDGGFSIRVYAGGELVPPLGVLEAAQGGTVECGFTAGFYYLGRMPALLFDTGVPFGMTPRMHLAWMRHGGGMEMMRELYEEFNVVQFPAGATGAQMGGWFRQPIDTVEDLEGLRIRAAGFLGNIYADLGAVPQQIPGADLYSAMERGTLDAVEFVGPYDDERLGFHQVAQYYYAPGVLELNASICFIANREAFNDLPANYQAALETACTETYSEMLSRYDSLNVPALRRLVSSGIELRSWSTEIMSAMKQSNDRLLEQHADENEDFRRVYSEWRSFLNDQLLWLSVNDGAAQNFLLRNI
jgi:TRAP-type mannitol/chloroaromatic compound transport system substrate-binding protein